MRNITAYLVAPEKFELYDSEMPAYGPDDVLVSIVRNGICGSDMALFHDPTLGGTLNPTLPIVLGHECSGYIAAVGKNIKHFREGDPVTLEPGVPCGKCKYCMNGRYNICPNVTFMAAPPFKTGSLSKYVVHPANLTFKLHDKMDITEGALIEPLSVGLYASRRAQVGLGSSILILGAGTIGLMTLMSCVAMGAKDITVVDIFESRLNKALTLGATRIINSKNDSVIETVYECTDGYGVDYVFETAGNPVTAAMTASLVSRGGKIIMVGNIHGNVPFDFFTINNKEADILSIFRYKNIYPMAIDAVAEGKIPVLDMVTRTFDFEHAEEAFKCALYEKNTNLKVMITD